MRVPWVTVVFVWLAPALTQTKSCAPSSQAGSLNFMCPTEDIGPFGAWMEVVLKRPLCQRMDQIKAFAASSIRL